MVNPTIVIAGAGGFVGRALIEHLLRETPDAKIIALARRQGESQDPRVTWRACDLFSETAIAHSLPERVDVAYYLVHSMGPTARLDQGSFADYDLILADNFARAIANRKVRQLIYLGGLVPESTELSLHLRSRMEVEEVFLDHKLPCTFLRAGLILGPNGSSFQMLIKLVRRLHILVCPAWTQTLTTPIDLPTVVDALIKVAKDERHLMKTYDLAGCQPLTYLEMMRQTARHLRLKRLFLRVPFFSLTLSRLWVSLITNTPRNLVYPLVESLRHQMVARPDHMLNADWKSRTYEQLLTEVSEPTKRSHAPLRRGTPKSVVRSVQRLQLPQSLGAQAISEIYFDWLSRITARIIRVSNRSGDRQLNLFGRWPLIELKPLLDDDFHRSTQFVIAGGLLVDESTRGRLEFRLVLKGKIAVVAIHDYSPALPWFIYKYTQAIVHVLVMHLFARHLGTMASQSQS